MMTQQSHWATRLAGIQPSAVNRIRAQVDRARAAGRDPVLLLRGEPDFATPAHIVEAATAALAAGHTQYPPNAGLPELRGAIVEKLRERNGFAPAPDVDEVLVTTGATEGLFAALQALLDPGDEVLLAAPAYDVYASTVRLCGGAPVAVPAQRADDRLGYPLDALRGAITDRTRALILNNPWNPTGAVLREAELEAIAELARVYDLSLIVDEIYEAIVFEPHAHCSLAALFPEVRDRCATLFSCSKSYAMTGWRLGYVHAARGWIDAMYLALQQWSRGPATFVQRAGVTALTGDQTCVAEMRAAYARRRESVLAVEFDGAPARWLPPEGGFFALLDVSGLGMPSATIAERLLDDHDVVVMPGSAYGEAGEGLLRISFAAGGESLASGLERLRSGIVALANA